tara:strand:+ start:100 stop:840 length:741 start_codon:yes stop_codon:yes gene_type:complete
MPSNKKVILVGTGIKSISHITKETELCIKRADIVLFLVNEPILKEWIEVNAKKSRSLEKAYFSETDRTKAYKKITQDIVASLDFHDHVCVVFYGHPTVFVASGLNALKEIEKKDIESIVMPAISAEDCLFADMKIDPSNGGCYSIDATEFLLKEKELDISSHLILWQIGMICRQGLPTNEVNKDGLVKLQQKLRSFYPPDTEVYVYEAALYPGIRPSVKRSFIEQICPEQITTISTLYIPPIVRSE